MSDLSGPDEGLSTAEAPARPRVVVLVRARDLDALEAAPTAEPTPVGAELSPEEAEVEAALAAARADLGAGDTRSLKASEVLGDLRQARPSKERTTGKLGAPIEDPLDQPTERFKGQMKRPRSEADDALAAAVIQLDLRADPDPLGLFLGRSLLERAARAVEQAGAPRLILVCPQLAELPERREAVVGAAQRGFRGVVEVHEDDIPESSFERGRLLLLDGGALQDPRALASLARISGDRVGLLLSDHGDGLKARTDQGAIVEFGSDLQPNDGALAGALSCPVEDFQLMSQLGMRAALDRLSREERLIGRVVTETFARQFRDSGRAEQAERYCYPALAGGEGDGLFDQWFGRPIARFVTLRLLTKEAISPAFVSGVAAVVGAGGGVLLALASPLLNALAGVLLVISAVLDRSDGELARLRLDDRPRRFDFLLDHAILTFVLAAMAWGLDLRPDQLSPSGWDQTLQLLPQFVRDALTIGGQRVSATLVGVGGVAGVIALLAVSSWRGPPRGDARGLERFGDMLASSFGSRDYAYLVLIGGALSAALSGVGVMGLVLLGCSMLVFGFFGLLLLTQLIAPRPAE